MNSHRAHVLALAAVALAGLTFSAGSIPNARASAVRSHAGQDFPPLPGGTPFVVAVPTLNPPPSDSAPKSDTNPPSSTPKQIAPKPVAPKSNSAVHVAVANPLVRALVAGKSYRIAGTAPWRGGHGSVVTILFYKRATLAGTWLKSGAKPYRATYTNVLGLKVYVSTAGRVMVIAPKLH